MADPAAWLALAAAASLTVPAAAQLPETRPPIAARPASRMTGTFGGRHVDYRTALESFDVADEGGAPAARLVAISYVAERAPPERPILFAFNGGPIAPSAYLHMGAFGPQRVAVPDDLAAAPAAFRVVDNPYCPLDVADIVFFDPAGTGFSRVAPGVDPASQFSVPSDARQLAQLVLAWTRAHGRERSPVYLVGESYGTLRAPEAARQLAAAGRPPAGLILLGQATNIIDTSQRRGNAVSYAVSLPTLAAIAWWHGKADRAGRDFERFAADAERFATGKYLSLLASGDPDQVRQRAAAVELQRFTGIPADEWLRRRLRMSKVEFTRALLPGKRLGTSDARYVGPADGPDPFAVVQESYTRLFREYLARDLHVPNAADYRVDSPVGPGLDAWRYEPYSTPFGDWAYAQPITDLFARQPGFRLLVGNGWFDTQTTVGAMDYLLAQNGWPAARVRRITYQGGHMSYTVEASLVRLTQDVRDMLTGRW